MARMVPADKTTMSSTGSLYEFLFIVFFVEFDVNYDIYIYIYIYIYLHKILSTKLPSYIYEQIPLITITPIVILVAIELYIVEQIYFETLFYLSVLTNGINWILISEI